MAVVTEVMAETSGLKTYESVKSAASSAPEDDDDELQALRAAALLSMKARTKVNSASPNPPEVWDRPAIYPNYSRYQHAKRTPALGNQYARGQHTRSNLIVIQPVPLDGSGLGAPSCSSGAFRATEPPKLSLPQDRWHPRLKQEMPISQEDDTSKRKVSGKFSHFESSTESEESDDDDNLLRSGSASSSSAISLEGRSCDNELNVDSNVPADEEDTVDKFDTNSNSEHGSQSPAWTRDPANLCIAAGTVDFNVNEANPPLEAPSSPVPATEDCRLETLLKDDSPSRESAHNTNSVGGRVQSDCGDARRELHAREEVRTEVSVLVEGLQTTPEILESTPQPDTNDKRNRDQSSLKSEDCGADNGVSATVECGAHHREAQRKVSIIVDSVPQTEQRATPISWEKRGEGEKLGTLRVPSEGNESHSSSNNRLEARRRKFESNAPVCPTGGKIVLLKGQKCVDQTLHSENLREARSRSRSHSASPPLLRSVLGVVKVTSREPSPLPQPAVVDRKHYRRARGGRTVEVIMPDACDELSDASERATSSTKLPVHLRLGDAPPAASSSKKKKSKRKRTSRDSSSSAKRKRTKPSLDHGPRHREQRWRRKVCSLGPASP